MGDVIKSFLVGLGFGVDDASLAKFNKAIASAALKVSALYASIKIASAGIFYAISRISEGFEQMGYEMRLVAPPITKVLQLRQEMMKAYSAAGIDMKKAVQQSVLFNFSLAKTKYALDAVYKGVGIRFLPLLTKQMDIFRGQIYANMPKIQNALEKFVNFIFKAFEATTILGGRVWKLLEGVYDFFKKLDDATGGWSTIVLAAVAAWKLLNLSFLATPLGMLIAGITTLLALWDDFKTFREGGESLINWGSDAVKVMVALGAAVLAVGAAIGTVMVAMRAYAVIQGIINALMLVNPFGLVVTAVAALGVGILALIHNWETLKELFKGGLVPALAGVGAKIMDFVGGATGLGAGPMPDKMANPVSSSVMNSNSSQSINQQTSIVVNGSADPHSTGMAVASQQRNVNADLARNGKGATR